MDAAELRALRLGISEADVLAAVLDAETRLPSALAPAGDASVGAAGRRPMKAAEVAYLTALRAVHGDNYAKMARDMKLNYLQETADHLRTRVGRMLADEA